MYDAALDMGDTINDDTIPEAIEPPRELEYLLGLWFEIKRGAPITWSELDAYQRATDTPLHAFETRAIIAIDRQCEAMYGNHS